MRTRQSSGVTLIEMLIVVGVIAMVVTVVITLSLQASRVYARTSKHIEPQESQMLALQRIQRDIRESMSVTTVSNATWMVIHKPVKGSDGKFVLVRNPTTGRLGLSLDPNALVYFLGTRQYPDPVDHSHWNAVPDTSGDTLFKADITTQNSSGAFPDARVIIDGILPTPMIPDPKHPGKEIPTSLFVYWPIPDNGTPNDPTDDPTVYNTMIKITLTKKLEISTPSGRRTENHTLTSQFALRNLQTSQ
ncbi:MAG: PilW family protein [Armatimonadota bacterium]